MILTRKIQVYINEASAEEKKQSLHTLYEWRDQTRRAANIIVSHKFVQQSVRDFVYIKDDIKEKFFVKDILKEGRGMSEENTTYRVLTSYLKGKVPSDIYTSLNRDVTKHFKAELTDVLRGDSAIRTYRNNIPIPFLSRTLKSTLKANNEGKYIFSFFGIPMALFFGRDRSNNQVIVDRCISGEYKICSSYIMIDDKHKKMYLLFTYDQPKQEYEPVKGKTLYALLGVCNPISYCVSVKAKNEFDSGLKCFTIGTSEEFFYRRRQIQEAVHRCQIENKYNTGGHGRKKKCKAIDRWHKKEDNYVKTKIHTYSRQLVNAAIQNRCECIMLMKQRAHEDAAQDDELVLRNWSYSGLKEKIEYKCKQVGISLIIE